MPTSPLSHRARLFPVNPTRTASSTCVRRRRRRIARSSCPVMLRRTIQSGGWIDKTIFHEGEQIAPAHADALPADLGAREPARHAGEPARLAGADPELGPDLLEREVVLELGLALAEQDGHE